MTGVRVRLRRVARDLAMLVLGGGVMLLLIASVPGCASAPADDPLGPARRALEESAARAVDAGGGSDQTIRAGVDRFLELFEDFDPETIGDRAGEVYAADAYFNDGFVELRGSDEIAEYLVRSAEAASELEIDVHDIAYSGVEVYVRWDMRFSTRRRSKTVVAPGVSHLRFDADGRIVFHRDYWDSSGALAELVPLMSSILRSIRSRL